MAFNCTDDATLTTADKAKIKDGILKHAADYYLGSFPGSSPKASNSGDFIRVARFLFSRDDEQNNNYFINSKIQAFFGEFDKIDSDEEIKNKAKNLKNCLTAYLLFDVNMAVAAYLTKPEFKKNELVVRNNFDFVILYNNLDNESVGAMTVISPSNRLMHTKMIEAVINRLLSIRDCSDFAGLFAACFESGYRLGNAKEGQKSGEELNEKKNGEDIGKIFSRSDLLKFFQTEADWAQGNEYVPFINLTGERIYILNEKDPKHCSSQDFIDKQIVIKHLFGAKK
jgi:hypothetical protein